MLSYGVIKNYRPRIACKTPLLIQQNAYLSNKELDEVCIIINETITSIPRSFARYRWSLNFVHSPVLFIRCLINAVPTKFQLETLLPETGLTKGSFLRLLWLSLFWIPWKDVHDDDRWQQGDWIESPDLEFGIGRLIFFLNPQLFGTKSNNAKPKRQHEDENLMRNNPWESVFLPQKSSDKKRSVVHEKRKHQIIQTFPHLFSFFHLRPSTATSNLYPPWL